MPCAGLFAPAPLVLVEPVRDLIFTLPYIKYSLHFALRPFLSCLAGVAPDTMG